MKRTIILAFWTLAEICHKILTDSEKGIQEETSFLFFPLPLVISLNKFHILTYIKKKVKKKIECLLKKSAFEHKFYANNIMVGIFSCKLLRPQDTTSRYKSSIQK